MKKRSLIVLSLAAAVMLVSTGAMAQLNFDAGAKAGVDFTSFWGDDADSLGADMKAGFVGGLYGSLRVTDLFGVRLEGMYTQKGGKSDLGGGVEGTLKLDYIEFPLLAVVSYSATPVVKLSAFAGPVVSFLVRGRAKVEGGGLDVETDVKDNFKTTDFGGLVGVGVETGAGPVNLFVDGRWGFGLVDVDDTASEFKAKNSAFSIIGGVSMPFPMGGV